SSLHSRRRSPPMCWPPTSLRCRPRAASRGGDPGLLHARIWPARLLQFLIWCMALRAAQGQPVHRAQRVNEMLLCRHRRGRGSVRGGQGVVGEVLNLG
uniref:Uncharacterized protein n=2 Tax=Aegilops tauschii subsp. strangulata TaxID=200361 RepID=A0A453CBX2_AEGTS